MKTLIATLVLLTGTSLPAFATDFETRLSESFVEALEETYGEKEGEYLTRKLEQRVVKAMDESTPDIASIVLTIEDAKPNRPTFQQLSAKPGLSYTHSISIGGAKVNGLAYDAAGGLIAEVNYDWYENDIRNAVGTGTWSDANRAFSRFASRFADAVDAKR